MLNPEIFEILKYVKERFPNSEVMLLSNGTILPQNPEIVKYIDNMGIFIDGGKKEIYGKIHTPAKFDHIIEIIKKWIEAKNKYNSRLLLNAYTTLSVLNIGDLSNIVNLVGGMVEAFGTHWHVVYCQPIVIKNIRISGLKGSHWNMFRQRWGWKRCKKQELPQKNMVYNLTLLQISMIDLKQIERND